MFTCLRTCNDVELVYQRGILSSLNPAHNAFKMVRQLLREYLTALEDKDGDAIRAPRMLENPFLKPNRLVGDAEIEQAHRRIFAALGSIRFELGEIIADDQHAIAEGSLVFARRGQDPEHYEIAVAAEADASGLQRLSIYADTRNVRRWVDGTIL